MSWSAIKDDRKGGKAMSDASWASGSVEDAADALRTFQDGLPVRLIATARSEFKTCHPDEELSAVIGRNQAKFDILPVVEAPNGSKGRIIGFIDLVPYMGDGVPSGYVRDKMQPLSEENLIGADASILTFIQKADQQRCRFVISGPEISGLVTLSDLQRLPVRAALFTMVTHLEITMAQAIRAEFPHSEDWTNRLSDRRKALVLSNAEEAEAKDAFVDTLLFTQFGDKVTIIKKSPHFGWGKNSFKKDMDQIQDLRDNLAHGNNYAATPEDAGQVCETVRLIDHWIKQFTNWPPRTVQATESAK